MKKILSLLLVLVSTSAGAVTTPEMVREITALYNSLEARDPARLNTALRLADTLFQGNVEIGNDLKSTKKDLDRQVQYRNQAIHLYEASLTGLNGIAPAPQKVQKARIQFQLGRLYTDNGQQEKADRTWRELIGQSYDLKVQREAAMRMAERLELSNQPAPLQEAGRYYDLALKTCDTNDLCSYVDYRRAWVFYRLGNPSTAIDYAQRALKIAHKTSINEILRDTVLFLSHSAWEPEKAVALIEGYSKKYNRPDLVETLADAYNTSDHRLGYVYTLEYINKREPQVARIIRLMDAYYGIRNWDGFKAKIAELQKMPVPVAVDTKKEMDPKTAEVEKILYRLSVQLDGERASKPERAPLFKDVALLYIAHYPASTEKSKVLDGWLAAETDTTIKLAQLKTWITAEANAYRVNEEIRLRKIRASVAAKAKNYDVVSEESAVLANSSKDSAERRESSYQYARSQYELKKFDKALPIFVRLAKVGAKAPDQWAILSQNLALDILGQEKKYPQLMAQAATWTADTKIAGYAATDEKLKKEVGDMTAIEEKANFENAMAMGQTPEALKIFADNCFSHKFLPKSCENAKILSVQLKDQKTLIAVLKQQEQKSELAAELEFGGRFSEAADMLAAQLNPKKSTLEEYLKVALLYELAGKLLERDRTLRDSVVHLRATKTNWSAKQEVVYSTLRDADLLSADLINLAWSEPYRLRLMDELEGMGKGTPVAKTTLLKTCGYVGDSWNQIHLASLKAADEKQSKIHFYGKNSQKLFNARVAALKALVDQSQCYLKGANPEYRVSTIATLSKSYKAMADEILNSPLPDGLDEETLQMAKTQLGQMAEPFNKQAQDYEAEARNQLETITDPALKTKVEAKAFVATNWNFDFIPQKEESTVKKFQPNSAFQSLISKMQANPYDTKSVDGLRTYFEGNGQMRLASYFKGRIGMNRAEEVN